MKFITFTFQLDQASLGLSREYLVKGLSDRIVKAYYDYMVDVAVILGANRETAAEELRQSLDFEMKLANVSLYSNLNFRNFNKIDKNKTTTIFFNQTNVDFGANRKEAKRHSALQSKNRETTVNRLSLDPMV